MSLNLSWIEEYLSDEWSGWDLSTFKKYNLTEKETYFSWWVTGDVRSCFDTINELFKLINQLRDGQAGEFLGNSYEVVFDKNAVLINKPISKETKEYSIEEFELALLEWEFQLIQYINPAT